MGPCRHTAIAVRCAMTVPAHLKCSLTRPSSRPGSGAVDRPFYPCITPCCLYRVDSVVNSPAKLPVGPTDRVVRCPRPVMAGRRERRRPAEATPLGQLRVWTTLFGPFTGGAWERQAPPRGAPSGTTPPRWTRRTWAIHPAALSRLLRGVASRDQPPERLRFAPPPAAGRGLFPGVGHGSLPCAATAQQTKQESVAGAPPPFGSAWGPIRWFFGRPSPRLGPRVSGSFTSNLVIHVNRIGGRFAGADRAA